MNLRDDEYQKLKRLADLGRRAVDWYLDMGVCFFCAADDHANPPVPHEDCDVGEMSEVIRKESGE